MIKVIRNHSCRVNGFTLVEVLIGLALLGLLMTMLYSGLYTSSRSWEAGDRQARNNDDQRQVLSFIRRQISQAVPVSRIDDGDSHILFRGERDTMYYVARLPAHRGGTDLYLAALAVSRNDGNHRTLVLRYEPLTSNTEFPDFGEAAKSRTLIDRLDTIELAYFGSEKPEEEPRWHHDWEFEDRLPTLIRLTLAVDNENTWPELLLRLPAKVERGQPQMILVKPEPS